MTSADDAGTGPSRGPEILSHPLPRPTGRRSSGETAAAPTRPPARGLGALQPVGPRLAALRPGRPALAAGASVLLMAGLCASTLSPEPAATSSATPVIADLAGPVPLRAGEDRASRGTDRTMATPQAATDLERESEAEAADNLLVQLREEQRAQAAAKATDVADLGIARPSGGSPAENRELGRFLTLEWGWNETQFNCLDRLYVSESNWRTTADNPTSSAYGIPQALPGSKMSSAGADWATNPETQILWGLGYIEDRFGTPCGAWSFKQANGWY